MKTIGLLGGMSWESSRLYYSHINQAVRRRLGGLHSAKIILNSVEFQQIADLQKSGGWGLLADIMVQSAKQVELAGADCLLICANTMHKVYQPVKNNVRIPVLHIAQPTGEQIIKSNIKKVALLGTQFTMAEPFYKDYLNQNFDLQVLTPKPEEQKIIHQVIYTELCQGQVKADSKQRYLEIIENLMQQGAQGLIAGCTEICMLITEQDLSIPLFDTGYLHAMAAVDFACSN